jgi:hypothetical protein
MSTFAISSPLEKYDTFECIVSFLDLTDIPNATLVKRAAGNMGNRMFPTCL